MNRKIIQASVIGLILLLVIPVTAASQPILKYNEFKSGEEMDHSRVACYAQDEHGILWLGTWIGLCRYDGQTFQFFRAGDSDNQAQAPHRIVEMSIDNEGHIWCVSNDLKLFRFNRQTSRYTPLFPLPDPNKAIPVEEVRKGSRSIYCLARNQATWVVMRDGSLIRFENSNPRSYQTFPVEYGASQVIYEISEDEQGREWILSDHGVTIRGGTTMTDYPFNKITQIDGKIFLSSESGYLAEYKDEKLQFVNLPKSVKSITRARSLGNHQIALCTTSGLVLFNTQNDSLRIIDRTENGELLDRVTYADRDSQGRIWVYSARTDDLFLVDNTAAEARRIPIPEGRKVEDRLHLVIEDAADNIWVKPYHSDLCWWDEGRQRLRPYTEATVNGKEIPILSYNFFFFDHQKNLWISSGTKMFRLTFQKRQFEFRNEPEVEEVRALLTYDSTRILYGDKHKGQLCRTNIGAPKGRQLPSGEYEREYLTPQGQWSSTPAFLSEKGIYCMLRDSRDIVWVGTRGDGLYRLEPKDNGYDIRHFIHNDGQTFSLSNNDIYDIYEDERRHIWIATFGGGINLVDRRYGDIRFINFNNILQNYPTDDFRFVRCITGDGRGTLLAGTSAGLVNFTSRYQRPAEIVFHRQRHSPGQSDCLPNNVVMSVLWAECEGDSAFYVGTYGQGISRILNDTATGGTLHFNTYLNRDCPAGDVTLSAQTDRHGRVWTVAEPGISCFDPASGRFSYYDQTDFDHYYVLGEARPLIMPGGEMVVGAKEGFMVFNTETLHKSDFTPEIVFTGVKYPGDNTNRILFNDLDTLRLDADHRSVNIQFAALDFRPSRLMRYAYKMDEIDADWTYTTTPAVNYVNLPAGDFNLLVRSTNSDGVWCDNTRTLTIKVIPTFWETHWAYLVYLLAIAALIALAVFIYNYIYRLRQSVYIEKEMAAVKVNFFTDISHELRTPLTLIDGPIGNVLAQEPLSKQARSHLELARKNTSRMLDLVNQILDFRKVQTGHVRLTLRQHNILEIITRVKNYFNDMAAEKHIDYKLEADLPSGALYWLDADKVEKIFYNLLSNAFKYTEAEKAITISLTEQSGKLTLSVKDQGRGIEASKLGTIFDRFVSLGTPGDMQPSSGIGLNLVKELVQLHHGEIRVESQLGEGSTFFVNLPASREAYQGDPLVDFMVEDSAADSKTAGNRLQSDTDVNPYNPGKKAARPVTILVVEDNAELRQFIVSILSPDYRIREAENGKDALVIARSEEISFILTDVMMPVMDGMEMIRQIKSDPLICHIPIVVLSAKSSLDDRIEGLENGIDDYLTKPFSASYLKARIANLIHQRELLQQSFFAGMLNEKSAADNDGENAETAVIQESPGITAPQLVEYDKEFVKSLMSYFNEHMSEPELSVGDLASAVNMSRTSFYRKLKSVLGLTPVDFIRQVRIRRAVQMINEGNDSLSGIAYSVGFSDPKYFSKCFKKDMGMPPAEYKVKAQKKI